MAAPRSLFTRKQLLELVVELRKVEGTAGVDPEQPLEVVEGTEAHEREHSSPSILGG